ncbi:MULTISPECIES: hypothetical protein [unclassified Pseudoalteromonas]|uniref:hypothetical protein n=1 Tax=unclassified Pseudoalteromonas TaxID=194690 RepID=UPI0020983A8C|nr:hypothetical protein [Pseudoalteromonas sp. XMcav2-N]MCO7188581.1 hypothetical protein [Pseudoalteromonas sp. XMcav2-N]
MDRKIILAALSALLISACNSTPKSSVTNYEADGSLGSTRPAKCVSVAELSNTQNPVDIFTGLNICLTEKNYSNAAELYFAGMSYGFFDTKRVSDKTAHQAISVLRMNLFGAQSQDNIDKFQMALTKLSSDNTEICQSLTDLGAPAYKPTYMIQHGIGAFTGQSTNDGLVENFDAVAAWKDTLSTIAKCG